MSLRRRACLILAKKEVSYGVDPTPTGAANAILARNFEFTPMETEEAERELIRSYFGNFQSMVVAYRARLQFEVELASSGAAGTAPPWGPLLQGCAFAETVNAAVSVVYNPITDSHSSITIYFQKDGVQHKMLGCRGNVEFRLNNKAIPVMAFTFTGLYSTPTDTANATPTFTAWQTPKPVSYANTPTLTLFGQALVSTGITMNMNNTVVHRSLIGGEGVLITDRRPAGTIAFEAVPIATRNWLNDVKDSTLGVLSMIHGSVAGSIIEVGAPKAQVGTPTEPEEDGLIMNAFNLRANPNTGNDEFIVTAR